MYCVQAPSSAIALGHTLAPCYELGGKCQSLDAMIPSQHLEPSHVTAHVHTLGANSLR